MESKEISEWVKAGGYVLSTWNLPDVAIDEIGARIYEHPAIPNREVVRLCPAGLSGGADSAMEVLGFSLVNSLNEVAVRARQALGFPETVLISHPEDARLALETNKKLKRAMTRASSKPGRAKEEVVDLAKGLEKSNPHFLPSFFEEVGRLFVASGNTNYAGQFFGKAREAEQKYALDVDENQRRDAFLEFALMGALTSKVMSDYSKVLTTKHGTEKAYQYYFDLCVRRTMGGGPPSAQMATDLKRLARAAKLDPDQEATRFVSEVAEAPALLMAPPKFWADYEDAFVKACESEPRLKGVLLNLVPKSGRDDSSFGVQWLQLLRRTGALQAVLVADGESVQPELRPQGSAATWFDSWLALVNPNSWYSDVAPDEVFALLQEMAPRLRADGIPLTLEASHGDADVLDFALELGIPVSPNASIELRQWANGRPDSEYRRRDLQFLASSEVFAERLNDAVAGVVADVSFQRASKGKSGLHSAKKRWLDSCVTGLNDGFWPAWASQAYSLSESVSASLFAEFPDHYKLLRDLDPVPSLLRSIRAGLMEEIGWKALDDAIQQLKDPKGEIEVEIDGAFPYAIAHNGREAIVVGPEGRVLEHTFAFKGKKQHEVRFLRYSGGQLLVVFDEDWDSKLYWSGNPKAVSDSNLYWRSGPDATVVLKDGRIFDGERAWGPPETDLPDSGNFVCDGTSFWKPTGWYDNATLVEIDPETGQTGRDCLPEFFERFAEPGYRLHHWDSQLFPIPANPGCFIPTQNGLWGLVAREDSEGNTEYFSIFGEKTDEEALGKIRFPGASQDTVLYQDFRHGNPVISLKDSDLSWPYLFLMTWRDEAGSRMLREASEADAATWLMQAFERRSKSTQGLESSILDPVIQKLIGYGTSKKAMPLADALTEFLDGAAESVITLASALELADPTEFANTDYSYANLATSMLPLGVRYYEYSEDNVVTPRIVHELSQALKGGPLNASLVDAVATEFIAELLEPETLAWFGARSRHRSDFARLFRHMASMEFGIQGEGRVISLETKVHEHGLEFEHSVEKYVQEDQHMIVFQWKDVVYQWSTGPLKDFKFTHGKSRPWTFPSPEQFDFWADLLESEENVLDTSDAVYETLASVGHLSPGLARLIWAGMPMGFDWRRFSAEELELLGLKSSKANAAQKELRELHPEPIQAIREAMRLEPNPFSPNAITALAEACSRIEGNVPPPPTEFTELWDLIQSGSQNALKMILDLDHPSWAIRDFEVVPTEWGEGGFSLELKGDTGLQEDDIEQLVQTLIELAHLAPPNHSIRQQLVPAAKKLRSALEDERFLVSLGVPYGWVWGKDLEQQIQMLGVPTKGKKPFVDDDLTIFFNGGSGIEFFLRTSKYLSGQRSAHLEKVLKEDDGDAEILKQIDYVSSGDFDDLMRWGSEVNTGDPKNPAECVSELIESVSTRLGFSPQAATLFLQMLVLVDLKSSTVKSINGWSTKEYNSACAELLKAELVIEAKRARAGRKHFLDGPWVEQRSPRLPYESWKASWVSSQNHQLPTRPLPDLFRKAWERWESGDRPSF